MIILLALCVLSVTSEITNDTIDFIKDENFVFNGISVVSKESDVINERNDVIYGTIDVINKTNDVMNRSSDTLNRTNDVVNKTNDVINRTSDTLNRTSYVINGTIDARNRTQIRLTGGVGEHEGNVQILVNFTTWKYICDDDWDIRDAKVVCRELGYAKALNATANSTFTINAENIDKKLDYNSTFWSTQIECNGDEKSVRYCNNGTVRIEKCRPNINVAGVICTNVTDYVQTKPIPSKASGQSGLQIRLSGQSKHGFISMGYLEVFHDGVWGAVCDDGWDYTASYVVCGNLGYPDYELDHVTPSDNYTASHYWMNNVRCEGMESELSECDHDGWTRHVCKGKPVYLSCKRSPFLRDNRFDKALISNHNLRLRAGYRHSEGRVEILHKGEWGSICHDNWSIKDANVFCRQIGFGTAYEAVHNAHFGQGSGRVWMDEVKCDGYESTIEGCKHGGWGVNDCGHKEDAGVKCHYPYGKPDIKVKLWGHRNPYWGHIRVMYEGRWTGICGIGWGLRETAVVCRQLGLGYPKKAMSTTDYGMVREFSMYDVKCSGDELSIHHCSFKGPKVGRCRFYEIATIQCTPNAPDLVMDVKELQSSVKLDTRTLASLNCAYEEKCLGSDAKYQMWWPDLFNRTLLRFSARFWNRGTADFRPIVRKRDWIWHDCHQHYHSMERFADYDFTDENGIKVGEGHKASFCLEDYECEKGIEKIYNCARKGRQGVTVNCADTYRNHLDCQWIDITRLPAGYYKLRVVLNPQNLVYETDYSNNIATCELRYDYSSVTVNECKLDTCEQMSHGGKGDGACCKFPFVYEGKQYRACTTEGGKGGHLWCATTGNYDVDGLWGYCGPKY